MENKSEIEIYQTADGVTKVDVRLEDETVWLTQAQMVELFHTARSGIVEHIKHIYQDGELLQGATCREFRQVQTEGKRQVTRSLPHYDLDMIISIGYRVNSKRATQFRQWATKRLKNGGGGEIEESPQSRYTAKKRRNDLHLEKIDDGT